MNMIFLTLGRGGGLDTASRARQDARVRDDETGQNPAHETMGISFE